MSPEILTIVMFVMLILGILLGFPIAFVMLGTAMLVGIVAVGPAAYFPMILMRTFSAMSDYILAAIPLFIFMGVMLAASGIADRLFSTVQILLGPLRGGLALTVVAVCTLLAATTGIVGAAVTLMGILALPAMINRNYDKALSAGTVAASGTLGIFIPPSVMLVIYAPMAGVPVTRLFAAAIVPGLILASLYIIYIASRCFLNPSLGPALPLEERQVPLRRKLYLGLTSAFPPLLLILAVLGTLFFGIAAVTEAAAVGALASAVMAACYKKLNWEVLGNAVTRTLTVTCMIMLTVVGAFVFTGTFMIIGGGNIVRDVLFGLPLGHGWILVVMLGVYFFLGIFMEWVGIVPILVPIFGPVLTELGTDPLWFGILACLCMQTSFLTPPMAPALFYLKGVAPKEIEFGRHIVLGCIPFMGLQLVGVGLVAALPQLALYLPSLITGWQR